MTGREAGAGHREGAGGSPPHRAAASVAGRGPNHPPAPPSPGSFLGPQAARSERPGRVLTLQLRRTVEVKHRRRRSFWTAGVGVSAAAGRGAPGVGWLQSEQQWSVCLGLALAWPGLERTASSTPGKRPPRALGPLGRGGEGTAPSPGGSPRDSSAVWVHLPPAVLPPGPGTQPAQSPALGGPCARGSPAGELRSPGLARGTRGTGPEPRGPRRAAGELGRRRPPRCAPGAAAGGRGAARLAPSRPGTGLGKGPAVLLSVYSAHRGSPRAFIISRIIGLNLIISSAVYSE